MSNVMVITRLNSYVMRVFVNIILITEHGCAPDAEIAAAG